MLRTLSLAYGCTLWNFIYCRARHLAGRSKLLQVCPWRQKPCLGPFFLPFPGWHEQSYLCIPPATMFFGTSDLKQWNPEHWWKTLKYKNKSPPVKQSLSNICYNNRKLTTNTNTFVLLHWQYYIRGSFSICSHYIIAFLTMGITWASHNQHVIKANFTPRVTTVK